MHESRVRQQGHSIFLDLANLIHQLEICVHNTDVYRPPTVRQELVARS